MQKSSFIDSRNLLSPFISTPHSILKPARFVLRRRALVVKSSNETAESGRLDALSYSKQYDTLFKAPINPKRPVPKPSFEAQRLEPDGKKVLLSDVVATVKRTMFNREWSKLDIYYGVFILSMHIVSLAAPWTYSPQMALLLCVSYILSGMGITLSFHRHLSHRSFTTPKWLEYFLAYFGVLAGQGNPIQWVSHHRYHHVHTDTPLDPHSPYEGFFWSHMGWLLDQKITSNRVGTCGNVSDMENDPFYRWISKTYIWHIVGLFVVLLALGGVAAVVWLGALRMVLVYHATWFVNSAAHVWGTQSYKTKDLSRNLWWVAVITFGEGWHNNHHAFEYSARHGLEWWQIDATWCMICLLEKLGLAWDIKLPTEAQKKALAIHSQT